MNLWEFRSKLQKIEKHLPGGTSWHFLCDGSPLTCRIFLVGINPAREIEESFWDFWDDSRGFRRVEFIRKLKELPGGLTRTRKYIEIVAAAARPREILETNIYPYAKPRAGDLTAEQKRTDAFDYLLHTIKPRVILAHGDEAKQFFRKHSITLVENEMNSINFDGLRIKLLPRKHLSYQTSYKEALKIGQALARALV